MNGNIGKLQAPVRFAHGTFAGSPRIPAQTKKKESRRLFSYEIFNQMIEEDCELKAKCLGNSKLVEIDRHEDIAIARKVFAK